MGGFSILNVTAYGHAKGTGEDATPAPLDVGPSTLRWVPRHSEMLLLRARPLGTTRS